MLAGNAGENINGPSLVRAPSCVSNRLGTYYLYFAHHNGSYIRLAYADKLEGPWTIYKPGTLSLADAPGCTGHIASPDVHVDESRKEMRMYFHGPARGGGGQKSFVATSNDGLHFKASSEPLGIFYFRIFRLREKMTFELREELFNAFNRLLLPGLTSTNALATQTRNAAGVPTSGFGYMNSNSAGGQRNGQLLARFQF